jgi:hypothetical protein
LQSHYPEFKKILGASSTYAVQEFFAQNFFPLPDHLPGRFFRRMDLPHLDIYAEVMATGCTGASSTIIDQRPVLASTSYDPGGDAMFYKKRKTEFRI